MVRGPKAHSGQGGGGAGRMCQLTRKNALCLFLIVVVVTAGHVLFAMGDGSSEALEMQLGLAFKPFTKWVKESVLGIGKRPGNYAHFLRDFVYRSFLRDYPNPVRLPTWAVQREPAYFARLKRGSRVKIIEMKEGTSAYRKLFDWDRLHAQYGPLLQKQGDVDPSLKSQFSFFPFFHDNATSAQQQQRVIYLSRRNSARRRFTPDTEKLLLSTLTQHVPELEDVLITSHWSMLDQAKLFTEARVFVTLHGAGLANILYMPPGSHVIEIMPRNYTKPTFTNLAKLSGVRHTMVMLANSKHTCSPVAVRCDPSEWRDTIISISKPDIDAVLRAVLDSGRQLGGRSGDQTHGRRSAKREDAQRSLLVVEDGARPSPRPARLRR